MTAPVRCCPVCRMVQARARACRGCGRRTLVGFRNKKLYRRRTPGVTVARRDTERASGWRLPADIVLDLFALMAPFVLGLHFGLPGFVVSMAVPFLTGALLEWFQTRLVDRGHASALAPAPRRPPLLPPPEAVTVEGVAERLVRVVEAPLAGANCLAVATVVRRRDDVLLRAVEAAAFAIVTDGGERFVVTGAIELVAAAPDARAEDAAELRRLLDRLGVPPEVRVDGVAEEVRIEPGQRVEARGARGLDTRHGLGGYRDAGAPALVGEPGRPVLLTRR